MASIFSHDEWQGLCSTARCPPNISPAAEAIAHPASGLRVRARFACPEPWLAFDSAWIWARQKSDIQPSLVLERICFEKRSFPRMAKNVDSTGNSDAPFARAV